MRRRFHVAGPCRPELPSMLPLARRLVVYWRLPEAQNVALQRQGRVPAV